MAVDCRADRCGQRRGRVAACVNCVDGRAAVVAEAFGVELVIRMLCIEFHAVQKRVLHVVGREVESPLVDAVGCGADIVIRCVVRNAEAGAEFGKNLVLRCSHMLDVRVVLDDGVILVVVRPTGEDHHTAVVVERLEGVQLVLGIGLGILLGRFQTAGRSRQDDGLVLGIAAGRDELLAGLQHDRAHGIFRGQLAEVAHGVLIVACNVFVVVRGVNADVDKLACVKHIERDVLGERVLLAVLLDHGRDLNSHDAGLCRGILEFHILRAACSQRDGIRHGADGFAADGIGDGLDGSGLCLTVEERGGDGQFFVGDRGRRAAFSLGNAKLERFADPDGSGHGQIAVALGDADEVIGVLRRQFHADGALGEICGTVPCIGDLAGVDDQLDLGDGIGAVGIVEGDLEVQLIGNVDDGAHHVAVDRVVQIEVLVLGGVHTARSERCIDAVFGKVVGQDDVAGVVGVAPAALVVILVVGRGDVPALVERHDVLLVAGIIAACADLAFAVADFDHVHTGVNDSIPVTEVNEVAERRARVVELADGLGALRLGQQLIIRLQARVLGLVVERRVIAGDDAGGVEGVDMAGTAGPRHFKARNGDHFARVGRVEGCDSVLVGRPAVAGIGILDKRRVIQSRFDVGVILAVEVVGMVGECDEVNVRIVRQRLDIRQCAVQRASAVGILRVGVQLAEVALEGRLADGEGPGLAGFLFIRTLDRHSYRDLAVRHIGSRGVGDLAVRVGSIDLRAVDSHYNAGGNTSVRDLRGDLRPLFGSGLRTLRRRYVGDHRLVEHGDLGRLCKRHALIIFAGDSHDELLARHIRCGDGNGIAGFRLRVVQRFLTQLDGQGLNAEYRVNCKIKRIGLSDICRKDRAEVDRRCIDDAVGHVHAVRHGIEEEGVDGVIRDFVHAVGLEAVAVILQVLAVFSIELRRAALQLIAAHAAGAGADEPVGVVSRNALFGEVLAVERVVAGAVGAEVAIGFALEAEVFAVLLDGEHNSAVRRGGLTVLDLGIGLFDGLGIVLRRQDCLRVLVVDHELVAGLGQIAGGLVSRCRVDPVERELARILLTCNRVVLIGFKLVKPTVCRIRAGIAGQRNSIITGTHKFEGLIFCAERPRPAIITRLNAIAVSTGRCNGHAVFISQRNRLSAYLQRPNRAFRLRHLVLRYSRLYNRQPLPAEFQRCVAGGNNHDIRAVGQLVSRSKLSKLDLSGFFLDRICKRRFFAALHAVLRGLDGEGVVLVYRNGRGILDVIARGLIEDFRALGRAGEGDLCPLGNFARRRRGRRGRDLLGRCGRRHKAADVVLSLRQLVERHAEVFLRQTIRAGAVGAELVISGEVFHVDLAILTGQAIAGHIVGCIFCIADFHVPLRRVTPGQVQVELAVALTHREDAFTLREGVCIVLVLRDRPDQILKAVRRQGILIDRRCGGGEIVAGLHFACNSIAVASVVDHDLVIGRNGLSLDVLVDQLIDFDGNDQLFAVVHAVLLGHDGVRLDLRSRDRAGVFLILRACGLVVDRCAVSCARELDLRANLDLSAVRYVRSRGRDLLLGCVELVERKLMRIAAVYS